MISLLATEVVVVLYRQCSLEKKNDREYIFYFIDKEKYPMIARMANENSSKVYYILPGRSGKKKKKIINNDIKPYISHKERHFK